MPDLTPRERRNRLAQKAQSKAEAFAEGARAENTRKAYTSDWKQFARWCNERDFRVCPAEVETVALYVADCADTKKVSSLERSLSAISQIHKMRGHESPALTSKEPLGSVWQGIVRDKGRSKRKVAPLLTEDVKRIIDGLSREDEAFTIKASRNRALLLVGFAGGLRRSEIADLTVEDITFGPDGMRVYIRKSKTDQEQRGHAKGIVYAETPLYCPVRSLKSWLQRTEIEEGPLFRGVDRWGNVSAKAMHHQSVSDLIKDLAAESGLERSMYSGHSLRAGFTTQAARAGVPERIIMGHTGHKSKEMVREYIHEGSLFENNATDHLGL